MKTRAIILAGGEGTRLGVLTAKRTKPAVPFAGKYRIIDFPLSNCVNSDIFDVFIIAQYRPHSLIEHIGAGGPWDLNRDFTGGIRIYTPYKSRGSDWFVGTADAVQQNFSFIKQGNPDLILLLSGDHVYTMDYTDLIDFHLSHDADLTVATIQVPINEAPRFGIVDHDENFRVTAFVEKPENPPSNLANMGIYLFNRQTLDKALWEDHLNNKSTHDFGKDIIPALINASARVFAYPFEGYWVDVGTVNSYYQSQMDLLNNPPFLSLNNRDWIIHTRTEERPPINIHSGATIEGSMICDGCEIESGATIIHSILSPGVVVKENALVRDSILLTDSVIGTNCKIISAIIDKQSMIGERSKIGESLPENGEFAMIGKGSILPAGTTVRAGGMVSTDVIPSDFSGLEIKSGEIIFTRRLPYEF
jgi:glucose-1-phosphate adenylyltransferase